MRTKRSSTARTVGRAGQQRSSKRLTLIIDDFEFSTSRKNRKLKMGSCACGRGVLVIDGECVWCLEARFPLLKECYGQDDQSGVPCSVPKETLTSGEVTI